MEFASKIEFVPMTILPLYGLRALLRYRASEAAADSSDNAARDFQSRGGLFNTRSTCGGNVPFRDQPLAPAGEQNDGRSRGGTFTSPATFQPIHIGHSEIL